MHLSFCGRYNIWTLSYTDSAIFTSRSGLRLGCHLYTWLAQTYTGWCNRDYTLSVYKRLHLLLLALDGKVSLGCKNKGNSQLMIIFGMAKANTNNGWPNNVVLVD